MNRCQFDGCDVECTRKWCLPHSAEIRRRRKCTRQAALHESYYATRGVIAPVQGGVPKEAQAPRESLRLCGTCGGMPWARCPGRSYRESVTGTKKLVAPNWRCIECNEPWGPEPAICLGSALRSNMAQTVAYGQHYGGEPTVHHLPCRQPTGRRKGAKGT